MTHSETARKKRVRFEYEAEPSADVFLAGSFTGWNSHPKKMRYQKKLRAFTATVLLPPGRHEYKFAVNGVWHIDPNCPDWDLNPYGSLNSVLTVT